MTAFHCGIQSEEAHARSWQEVAHALETSIENGLTDVEANRRLQQCGYNRLHSAKSRSALAVFIDQFKSILVVLLAIAAILSFVFGELIEGASIAGVILINAGIGFFIELRAVRSMEVLERLSKARSKVVRSGKDQKIADENIAPGDVILLEGGDIVPADLRLFEASKLQADESALTGESLPVGKKTQVIEDEPPLAERNNMLYKGTAVTRGSGKGLAVSTGMETELGHIATMVQEAEQEFTPLEKRLDQLGRKLVWVTLGIAVLVAGSGILVGRDLLLMIETAIALAVAAVPEGLPIVATIALARGMQRMARRNALINRLSAVETLGAVNIIFTDKTGTLTENRMTVTKIRLSDQVVEVSGQGLEIDGDFSSDDKKVNVAQNERLRSLIEVGVLCNNASLQPGEDGSNGNGVGDPLEVALLVAGAKADLSQAHLTDRYPEVREVAFDPDLKMMATFHRQNDHYRVAVKGAPEVVVEHSKYVLNPDGALEMNSKERKRWLEHNDAMAREGLRVLALGLDEGNPKIMHQTPRDPQESILTRGRWALIGIYGALITVSVLGAFGLAFEWLKENREVAVTISFLTLAFAQLWHVFNMRTASSNFFRNEIIRNPYIWGALALCILLLAGAVYLPGLAKILKVTDPGWQGWLLVIGMSLLPWAAGQIINSTGLQSRIIQRR
jgi:Ca2+-transporting ATPase